VETRVHYDQFGEVVATHYVLVEVKEVIPLPTWSQLPLKDGDGEEDNNRIDGQGRSG
jgi:hypothetical protein